MRACEHARTRETKDCLPYSHTSQHAIPGKKTVNLPLTDVEGCLDNDQNPLAGT